MIDSDVIDKQSAEYLLTYLVKVKDRGVVGDMAWCKIALSVLRHLYFSDFGNIAHEALAIGIEKSTRIIHNGSHDLGVKLRSEFESIKAHWDI